MYNRCGIWFEFAERKTDLFIYFFIFYETHFKNINVQFYI